MKKKVAAVAISALMATTGLAVAVNAPAQAAPKNPPTITRAEFKRIKKGMTPSQVYRIVGSWGKITSRTSMSGAYGFSSHTREFKVAKPYNKYSSVWVDFSNNPNLNKKPGKVVVATKYAFWMRNF